MDPENRVHLVDAQFERTTFQDDVPFRHATFDGKTSFFQSTFEGLPMFDFAVFNGDTEFAGAVFRREGGWATFFQSAFHGEAWFDGATFHGEVKFTGMAVHGDAGFWGCMFLRKATFDDMVVTGTALFGEATFNGVATFERAELRGPAEFKRATFNSHVIFDGERMTLGALALTAVTFSRGVKIEVRSGDIAVDQSTFAAPSVLMGPPSGSTRVVSLRDADVSSLVLADLDLRPCRFEGAHNLDRLRFERIRPFARMPRGLRFASTPPYVWRWTDRQAIAEEYEWRLHHEPEWKWGRWKERDAWTSPSWLPGSPPLRPDEIARIYRSLRKGREDNKDEAGASDFYYGEMEMRRKSAPLLSTERFVLFFYWLLSGYALRASRALVSLLATVLVFAALFETWGFKAPRGFGNAFIFSLETATNLLGPLNQAVVTSNTGEVLQVALRVLGPLLLGLAVLSLRGRIRR